MITNYKKPLNGRGGIRTHELKSQDLANLHNNHSVTRPPLLIGFEPISSHSQYDILARLNYKNGGSWT